MRSGGAHILRIPVEHPRRAESSLQLLRCAGNDGGDGIFNLHPKFIFTLPPRIRKRPLSDFLCIGRFALLCEMMSPDSVLSGECRGKRRIVVILLLRHLLFASWPLHLQCQEQ